MFYGLIKGLVCGGGSLMYGDVSGPRGLIQEDVYSVPWRLALMVDKGWVCMQLFVKTYLIVIR